MQLLSLLKELSLHPKNAQELKGLILQLAVLGKLTAKWREENPNVEPASELLLNIQRQKEILIQQKIIKKDKVFPELDSEFMIDLPIKWDLAHLGRLSKQITDGTHHTPKYVDSGVKFLSVKDISSGKINLENTRFISPEEHEQLILRCKPEVGDIMFCRIGTLGVPVIVDIEEPFSIFVSVGLIKFFKDEVLPQYLQKVLDSPYLWRQYMKVKAGGSHTNKLNLRDIPNLMIPLPPLQEQKAIVEIVNQLFAEVEQLEALTKERISLKEDFVTSALRRLTETDNTATEWNGLKDQFSTFFTEKSSVKKLREAILQLAVQGKLTAKWREDNPNVEPASGLLKKVEVEKKLLIKKKKIKAEKPLPVISYDEFPFPLPIHWQWTRLQELASINGGFAFKSSEYIESGARVIRISDFNEMGFKNDKVVRYEYSDELAQYVLEDKNILLAMTGGTVGKSLFVDVVDELMVVNQRVATIKIINPVYEAFVNCVIPTKLIQDVIEEAKNSTNDNISMGDIKGFMIPLPPLEEQKAIVEQVNSLKALCDELEKQIETSHTQVEQLMQSCLKEVFEIA
jgi:type I restriction enzyme S subunit